MSVPTESRHQWRNTGETDCVIGFLPGALDIGGDVALGSDPAEWDFSALYTTGELRFITESGTAVMLALGLAALRATRQTLTSRRSSVLSLLLHPISTQSLQVGARGATPDPNCVRTPFRESERRPPGCGLGMDLGLLMTVLVALRRRSKVTGPPYP